MANTLIVKRSSVAGKVPLATDLQVGELAVNLADQKLYSKNAAGDVVQLGGGSGSGDVVGPLSATDNALARFDGTTGKLIQNSVATLTDAGAMDVPNITIDYTQYDTAATFASAVGRMGWDNGNGSLSLGLKNGNVELKLGEQEYVYCFNDTGVAITKGQVVYINGAQGNRVSVLLAIATSDMTSGTTIGLVAESIAIGAEGWVQISGPIYKMNTTGLTAGAPIYLSPTVAGAYTTTKPVAPQHLVTLGFVSRVDNIVGSIFIKVDNGYELDELHNVLIITPVNGNTLVYDAVTGVWENSSLTAGSGVSVTNGPGSITIANTAPDQTVALTGAGATSITGTYPNFTISSVNTTYGTATSTVPGLIELGSDTAQTVAANSVSATAARSYALQLNASGQGVTNVPWTDTVYSLPAATSTVLGGIELNSDTTQTEAANTVSATASRTYGLQTNAAGQGVVNVPWTDTVYSLPAATTAVLGGIKLGSDTAQTVSANTVSATASRSYALQVNASGQGVVNVPWVDTNSGGTVTSVSALTLATTGTDVSSSVANSTTTPVITLSIPTASAANRGALSATDWSTFNNKQPAGSYLTSAVTTFSAGTTGLTPSTATSGAVTLAGTLGIANGGTGSTTAATALTALGAYPASNPTGYTTNTGTVTGVTATAPVASTGGTAPVISMAAASATANGYLTSTDWSTFNGKQPAGSYLTSAVTTFSGGTTGLTPSAATSGVVTLAGTLAVANGGTGSTTAATALTALGAYPASNPTGYTTNTGTVTSVAALTLGTTGTDVSSSVATNTTTPVITLNIPTASAANRGALSATDWSTFNGKQPAGSYLTSAVTTFSGGTTGLTPSTATSGAVTLAGTLAVASGGTGSTTAATALTALGAYPASNPTGYTTNTGTVTGVTATAPVASTGGTAPVISMAAAASGVNGYMTGAYATKLDGIAAGATANTGTVTGVTATAPVTSSGGTAPVIAMAAAASGVNGYMTGAYATKLDGIAAGATANTGTVTGVTGTAPIVSSGGTAPAISMAAAASGVNGYMTGAYATKLDGIATGATNVTNTNQLTNGAGYVTAAGARTSVSFTAGSGAYNSSTGVFTIPTNTNQLTNGAGYITSSGSISGNATTATSASNGIGGGQTWQNPARAVNTVYQNTTGKTIEVCGSTSGTGGIYWQVSSDNVTWFNTVYATSGGGFHGITLIIPSTHYYRINGAATIGAWTELR